MRVNRDVIGKRRFLLEKDYSSVVPAIPMIFAAFFSGRGIGVLRLLDPVPRAAPHVCHCHAQQQLDGQHRQRSPRPLPRLGYVRHRTKWKLQTVQVFNDFCFACLMGGVNPPILALPRALFLDGGGGGASASSNL